MDNLTWQKYVECEKDGARYFVPVHMFDRPRKLRLRLIINCRNLEKVDL